MNQRFGAIRELLQIELATEESFALASEHLLPAAYRDWARVKGGAELLHRYSNTDRFWFVPHADDFVSTELGEAVSFARNRRETLCLPC